MDSVTGDCVVGAVDTVGADVSVVCCVLLDVEVSDIGLESDRKNTERIIDRMPAKQRILLKLVPPLL